MAMGGIAAEELIYGGSSTTAEDDIERATELAKEMVGIYGMSPELGRIRLLSKFDGYLGAEAALMDSLSPETMYLFDTEVRRLVDIAEARAKEVLARQGPELKAMVARLQEDETLEGAVLEGLLADVRPRLDLLGPGAALPTGNGGGTGQPAANRAPAAKRPAKQRPAKQSAWT
jgi:cell division protease FtsH